ncbi:MAG: hypothetical protein SFZ24_08230 [Planctomycetota bacterium]|nr:hypothetical protein [Planctomycetota bacterium]
MSLTGQLIWFCLEPVPTPGPLALRILEYLQGTLGTMSRFLAPDQGLRIAQALRDGDDDTADALTAPSEYMGQFSTLSEVAAAIEKEPRLFVRFSTCAVGDRMMNAVTAGVPESIRSWFFPCRAWVRIGAHDIVDPFDDSRLVMHGRTDLSIGFFGYGMPNNPPECTRQILALPEVRAIKAELEAICGPLGECILYSA